MRNYITSIESRKRFDEFKDFANSHPRLSRKAESELAIKKNAGDQAAFNILINSNLRYVAPIVENNVRGEVGDIMDYALVGTLGLLQSIERYNPDGGASVYTFAAPRIQGSIRDALRSGSERVLRVSRPQMNKFSLFMRVRERYEAAGHSPATAQRMALAESQMSHFDLANVNAFMNPESLDALLDEENYSSAGFQARSLAAIDKNSNYKALHDALGDVVRRATNSPDRNLKLSPDEAFVLVKLYGLENFRPISQREIADQLELTESRISQLRTVALRKLRQSNDPALVELKGYLS